MRNSLDPKNRKAATQAVAKVKVKARKAFGKPSRALVPAAVKAMVPKALAPQAVEATLAAEAKPLGAQAQRIELFNPVDSDDVAWAEAFAHAKQASEHKRELARRRVAHRMARVRMGIKYTSLAVVCMGIGASANLIMTHSPQLVASVLGTRVADAPQTPAVGVTQTETTLQPTGSIQPAEAPVSKKTVAMAHLNVEDAEGLANELIALPIRAVPAQAGQNIGVRLSGLPAEATLTSGKKLADGSWLLKDGEEQDVKLKLPLQGPSELALAVEAVSIPDGENVSPSQEMRVRVKAPKDDMAVVPTADSLRRTNFSTGPTPISPINGPVPLRLAEAKPQQVALPEAVAPASVQKDRTAELLARGDALLQSGDMAGARSFYQRAFEQGNGKAAASVARTYDPAVFKQMKVMGLKPNVAKAQEWYGKAAEAGDTQAARRAAALQAAK
jgi:hypothetical protein